jgi:hypothetical protein
VGMYLSVEGEKLYAYYKHFEKRFFRFLEKAKYKSRENDIHEFRISIKKIKGIYKLIDLLTDEFDNQEHLLPIKRLFKPAGKIRESQVNMLLLKKIESEKKMTRHYTLSQKRNVKKYRKDFDKQIQDFSPKELKRTRQIIKNYCKVFTRNQIINKSKEFVQERQGIIRDLLMQKDNIDAIHKIRITLKEISAILGLLVELEVEELKPETLIELKQYEDDIGLWHDYVILRESIDKFLNRTAYEDIEKRLELSLLIEDIRDEENDFTATLSSFVEGAFDIIEKGFTTPLNTT